MTTGVRHRRTGLVVTLVMVVFALVTLVAPAASAHVVPTSTVQLDVGTSAVSATVSIPLSDLEAASGIDLGDDTQAEVTANAQAIRTYLLSHFAPTSDEGQLWSVDEGVLKVSTTGDATTTGRYQQLTTTFTLTPPVGSDVAAQEQSFNLGYDAVVDRVATHVVIVTVRSDTSSSGFNGAYEVGAIERNTVTDTVKPLHVDLGLRATYSGVVSMLKLGMTHIEDGTDHQLFLLTLLLPAPLLARRRRWAVPVAPKRALRRIGAVTVSFTLGHSVTLALGALGVPVPEHLVEAMIAVSILVAAVHAIRPIFPGREAAVAAAFGLVHGLAFSEALRALHLTGTHLVLALLGFNLGIEVMQLVIVALVLPPLIVLARTRSYAPVRMLTAAGTAVAASGWLVDRLGVPNAVAELADRIGTIALPVVLVLWISALVTTSSRRRPPMRPRQSDQPALTGAEHVRSSAGPSFTVSGRVGRA